jgi:acyl dehydratase
MPKKTYSKDLMDPIKFNKLQDEYISGMNERIGEIWPWDVEQDHTWRHSNKLASADLIRHFCDAYGETNPLFRNADYASKTRHGGIIAPPTFLTCITPSAVGLEPDDLPATGFNGGAEWEWFDVVREGDVFHGFDTWLGWIEKKREGTDMGMYICTVKRTFINQRDEVVCNIYGHELRFSLPPTEEGLRFGQTGKQKQLAPKWKYTMEELEKVTETYKEMERNRRGANVRYWEDVKVGDSLGTVVQGPYDLMDVANFMVVQGYMAVSFGIKWDRIWNHSRFTLDEYNQSAWEPHLRDHEDLGYEFNQAAQSEAGLALLLSNWMGDDGLVRKFGAQARRMMPVGDCSWMTGKIVKKYVENGEYLVDAEMTCTTQRGVMHMPATATIRLLSREQMKKQLPFQFK